MRLHLKDLKVFSDCPAFYQLSKGDKVLIPYQRAVIESVIKKCHMQATETGHRTSWRTIIGWVDAEVFVDVNIENDESFRAAKVLSENILLSVQKWYGTLYMSENYQSYIDLDLECEIGNHIVISRIPIIQVAESVIITVFREVGMSRLELYNDLEIRGLAWLVASHLDYESILIRCLAYGLRGKMEVIEISSNKDDHERIEDTIYQVVSGIYAGFCYPSRTTQCKSCTFIRRCRL